MKVSPTSWAISPDLYLVCHPLPSPATAPPPKPEPTHHVLVLDCSGSMTYDLPRMATLIKAKLPSLIGEDDTVSIVWFSGRGETGVLIEGERLASLKDLSRVNAAIDRWLRPVGLTGFVDPLAVVVALSARLTQASPGRIALFLMSDGCDNCNSRDAILRAMENVAKVVASTTIVEFSLYADRPMLSRMAEKAGGALVFANDFQAYEPVFTAAMGKKGPPGAKKTALVLDHMPVEGFAFGFDGTDVLTFAADSITDPMGRALNSAGVTVPSHLEAVYYLSNASASSGSVMELATIARMSFDAKEGKGDIQQAIGRILRDDARMALTTAYAAMALYAQRVKPKIIWTILRALSDVAFVDSFGLCFGKQRYSAFVDDCHAAAVDSTKRFTKGYDPKRVPREDAPTILDVLDILARDERCKVLTQSDAFTYTRIGRKSVSKSKMLTVTEGEEVAKLAQSLGETREVDTLKEALAALTKIIADRKEPLKFTLDKEASEKGYTIDLVWNESQPNLSFRVRRPGVVDIAGDKHVPESVKAALPATIKTFDYRAYTVVKDGFVHLEWIPVIIPVVVYDTFVAMGVIDPDLDAVTAVGDDVMVVLDLRRTPVINQKMINEASARTLAENQWRLLQIKAAAKVYKHYTPERESKGFATVYGKEAAAWLDENGVSDSGGYSFESTAAKGTDIYLGKALDVKIPGFSSLPSVADVRERMSPPEPSADPKAKPKKPKAMTPAAALMAETLREVDEFLASPLYKKAAKPEALFEQWVSDQARAAVLETRKLQTEMARQKWAVTVGGGWCKEFSSFDERSIKLDLGGESREVTIEFDTEVKIAI